ncbi:SDR family NAD(P)-dependent oxidoreductase [Nonomuraea phyllanthi]|uniref:SDR family NAD(P)-dependent oxidoreductase n=1 Tax=Nonomuraea phyllanthi TaxID=2219224 RepID=A0A5C4W1V3_9ACTN|nr:SDR family NAD(P)-dependent oxidoreductase [Nonomuraea phyllanthi]KAB8191602.1 SDR family NAD(P)-dependent oxidoreductase [Nonomuraea phyllanthi]QFY13073.1 SDR family NAD(P)-dependent oxidoreductase [Nonomuraea phyllanthi]
MTITLITGANKGLGFETARRLIEAGHTVYAGARDAGRGREAAERLGARFVQIDVTDEDSVKAAAEFVRADAGRLDVLVNNAGIVGARKPVGETTGTDMMTTYDTNVFGVVRVTHAFLPLLEASDAPVVVNVGSGLGSLAATGDPDRVEFQVRSLDYNSSKTALVMISAQYAKAYPAIRFNTVDPGYTATDLNGHTGPQTVEEGAEVIVRMASIGADGPTSGYFDNSGTAVW